jgi:glutathione S-transferase
VLALYHYWDSVCSFKVRLCLAEKGLAWTDRHVDLLKFEQLSPEYLAINPNGVVPSLVHDGQVVIESSVINEYLDETFPDVPLRPADPLERARMRVWVKYEDDVVHPAVRPGTFNLMIKSVVAGMKGPELDALLARHPKPDVARDWAAAAQAPVDHAALEQAKGKLAAALARMEQALCEHRWLAGDSFSLADIALAPMIDRIEYLALAGLWQGHPRLRDWIEGVKARPSFAMAAPPQTRRMHGPLAATAG